MSIFDIKEEPWKEGCHNHIEVQRLELNKIHCIDCLEYMKTVPDKFFDLIITDPPYGINADTFHIKNKGKFGWTQYPIKTNWDASKPSKQYFDEMMRISKNQVIWGGNYFTDYLKPSMGWLVWDKGQRDFSLADGELAWTSFNKALRIFEMSRSAFKFGMNEKREHPTQKPIKLGRWVLELFAKEGDKIFDPYAGSGSFIVACKQKGFKYVGCELNQDYINIINQRLQQNPLFKYIQSDEDDPGEDKNPAL